MAVGHTAARDEGQANASFYRLPRKSSREVTQLEVLPKVLWWIHQMRWHYFKVEYVNHLPFVAGAMIDSHTTAEYWKNRTKERLGVLREHFWRSIGVKNDYLLFAIIKSVSRGKGQDPFLRSFYASLVLIQEKKLQVPSLHAVVVGSDMNAQTKFEIELRKFVMEKKIQDRARGECFGRITIEAMAFRLPLLGTAAGSTVEVVVNRTTGWKR
ncbi:hypothetical protein CR513_49443, partial [Mucuna pruriens]